MAGKFFDQWQVGEKLTHEIRRTVTETDNLLFSTMTHNPQPLHIDAEAAKAEFDRITARSTAAAYLAATDWMVIRQSETGQPVPDDILRARAEARAALSS